MRRLLLLFIAILLTLDTSAQLVAPVQDGDIYSFTVGNLVFELDASFGGRISSFKINGSDILYPAQNGSDFLWGSTLWPSPQTWPWPPPFDALEYDAYAGEIKDNKVILTSTKDDYTKLVFEKTFYVNSADSSVNIEYKFLNKGTSGKSVAAWEVSRVHSGGITFFPRGAGSITGAFGNQFETIDGIAWWEHSVSDPTNQKMFSDGKDKWFAHVTEDDYLFLKVFEEDVPYGSAAPNENEIELWHAGTTSYIELENQSAYGSIAAGDSMNYNLKWFLKEIPDSVDISHGSASLASFAASIADTPGVGVQVISKKNVILSVYPNPASEYISFTGKKGETYTLELFDITGKIVLKTENVMTTEKINVTALKKGLYIYKVKGLSSSAKGKLIIR